MKTTILLLFLAFALTNLALAQNNILISPHGIIKNPQPEPNIHYRNHSFLGKLDTLQSDSIEVHFPNKFLLTRELDSSNPQPEKYTLRIFELPASQSRMPIIPFDESVNYTILRKEFK
jgi:hypothetical protein